MNKPTGEHVERKANEQEAVELLEQQSTAAHAGAEADGDNADGDNAGSSVCAGGDGQAEDDFSDFFVSAEERGASLVNYSGADAKTTSSRDMVELLAFWVADEEYATSIVDIQEIIKLPVVTPVPRAHPSVLGITSLRGTIVPVVDLRRVLRLDERPITRQSRILVLRGEGDPVGLLVDRVTSVVRLDSDTIEATPRAMEREGNHLLKGVGRQGARLIIILDTPAVLGVLESAA